MHMCSSTGQPEHGLNSKQHQNNKQAWEVSCSIANGARGCKQCETFPTEQNQEGATL